MKSRARVALLCAAAVATSPMAMAKDCWFAPIRFVRVDGPRLYIEVMLPCAGDIPIDRPGKSQALANSLYVSDAGKSVRIAVLIDKAFCKPAVRSLHQYSYDFEKHVPLPPAKFRGAVGRMPYAEYVAIEKDACAEVPK